jgi:hypothetical protein
VKYVKSKFGIVIIAIIAVLLVILAIAMASSLESTSKEPGTGDSSPVPVLRAAA